MWLPQATGPARVLLPRISRITRAANGANNYNLSEGEENTGLPRHPRSLQGAGMKTKGVLIQREVRWNGHADRGPGGEEERETASCPLTTLY